MIKCVLKFDGGGTIYYNNYEDMLYETSTWVEHMAGDSAFEEIYNKVNEAVEYLRKVCTQGSSASVKVRGIEFTLVDDREGIMALVLT